MKPRHYISTVDVSPSLLPLSNRYVKESAWLHEDEFSNINNFGDVTEKTTTKECTRSFLNKKLRSGAGRQFLKFSSHFATKRLLYVSYIF